MGRMRIDVGPLAGLGDRRHLALHLAEVRLSRGTMGVAPQHMHQDQIDPRIGRTIGERAPAVQDAAVAVCRTIGIERGVETGPDEPLRGI